MKDRRRFALSPSREEREQRTIRGKEGEERADEQSRRRLLTASSIVIGTILARPINNFTDEQIPERRGIRDEVTEAVLQGLW